MGGTDMQSTVYGFITFYAMLCTVAVSAAIALLAWEGGKRRFGWMMRGQKAAGELQPRKRRVSRHERKPLTVVPQTRGAIAK